MPCGASTELSAMDAIMTADAGTSDALLGADIQCLRIGKCWMFSSVAALCLLANIVFLQTYSSCQILPLSVPLLRSVELSMNRQRVCLSSRTGGGHFTRASEVLRTDARRSIEEGG